MDTPLLTNRHDYHYQLPQDRIAQRPAVPRDSARLMILDRVKQQIKESVFRNITEFLRPGDLLVVNNSKVIPARLLGKKKETGAEVEVLLLEERKDSCWVCLCHPGKRLKEGARIDFGEYLSAEIIDVLEDGNRIIRFAHDPAVGFYTILDKVGHMPLPHYITTPLASNDEYQTVYAQDPGSAAAPTAGLHFTAELMNQLRALHIEFSEITLHVGLGTFRPVKEDDITKHLMHREYYTITQKTADAIHTAKQDGRRVIGVGTTTCRTLEATFAKYKDIVPGSDSTDIFIYPGYQFHVIDALITNFHLPESTLIMLVCAFAGYDFTMKAYQKAIKDNFRFFSFGDAMFIQ